MVKVTGPASSNEASGSINKTHVHSTWKGRNYVRTNQTPRDPKSDDQVSLRAMWKWLSEMWSTLTGDEQATWLSIANDETFSPANAFLQFNQTEWSNFQAPSKTFPADRDDPLPAKTLWTASGEIHHAVLLSRLGAFGSNWGRILFRGPTGFSPSPANAIAIVTMDVRNELVTYLDQPLEAGVYFYNARNFGADGRMSGNLGERMVTVT